MKGARKTRLINEMRISTHPLNNVLDFYECGFGLLRSSQGMAGVYNLIRFSKNDNEADDILPLGK